MNWNQITDIEQVNEILQDADSSSLIFKHSTSCSISAVALDRLERKAQKQSLDGIKVYYLDLIRYRDISNYISEKTNVPHESPQAIVLSKGNVVYEASHFAIDLDEIRSSVN